MTAAGTEGMSETTERAARRPRAYQMRESGSSSAGSRSPELPVVCELYNQAEAFRRNPVRFDWPRGAPGTESR